MWRPWWADPAQPGLPHLLRPGLDVVFIGYNPGLESARVGHYYAFRGNVFWKQLNESGLIGRALSHLDDVLLPVEAAIGFTDLCSRPTARAGELTRAEIVAGAQRLHRELSEYRPRFAVFSGRASGAASSTRPASVVMRTSRVQVRCFSS